MAKTFVVSLVFMMMNPDVDDDNGDDYRRPSRETILTTTRPMDFDKFFILSILKNSLILA